MSSTPSRFRSATGAAASRILLPALLAFLVAGPARAEQTTRGFLDRLLHPAPPATARANTAGAPTAGALAAPVRPDPRLTPGDTLEVTLEDIRTPGYSAKVRDVPIAVKKSVYAAYGIPHWNPGEYEVDHLIPLSIGGSNSTKNLWPESYLTGPWNAHVKDALEYRLLTLVRAGKVDLNTVQGEIAHDWIAAYKKYVGPQPARKTAPNHLSPGQGLPASPDRRADFYPPAPPPVSGGGTIPAAPTVAAARTPAPVRPGITPTAPTVPTVTPPQVPRMGQVLPKVWVNTRSGVYHHPASRYYGKTKEGKFLSEADALAAGFHAAPDND